MRDLIQYLENVKDKIIDFLNSQNRLDNATKNMWIGDVKEAYYNIVATYQFLEGISENDKKYLDSCRYTLANAKSRMEQSASELRSFNNDEAGKLEKELKNAFYECWNSLSVELNKFTDKSETKKPLKKVIKVSDEEYHLPCSICGEISAIFKIEIPHYENEKNLVFSGITHSQGIGLKHSKKIFDLLEKEKISETHFYIKKYIIDEGIDSYCPDCDKIYCSEHYNITEEWDEGFYDCSFGTCPEGHRRIIDD